MVVTLPRYPSLSGSILAMPPSVFEALKQRAQEVPGGVVPFHVGDTHLPPPVGCRLGELGFTSEHDPDLYKYSPPHGEGEFVGQIVDKVRRDNKLDWVAAENVQITSGATHALSCAVRTVMNPGDHMLLLAPHWPLMRGISVCGAVRPVELPFSQVLLRDGDADIEALLEEALNPATAGIYYSSPNNPDGKLFTRPELGAIARVAQRYNLWVISDEVYENFVFDGEHVSIASLPGMAERTLTVYSFSKSYGIPGLRVGYVVGPAEAITGIRKMTNHTVYNVPRAMQVAARAAMREGAEWVAAARELYREHRDIAVGKVIAPCAVPEGSTYLFLDLTDFCRRGEDTSVGVLERLVDAGMLLTPGGAFGSHFQKWARLCYTSVAKDVLIDALERLNHVLERG